MEFANHEREVNPNTTPRYVRKLLTTSVSFRRGENKKSRKIGDGRENNSKKNEFVQNVALFQNLTNHNLTSLKDLIFNPNTNSS